MKISHACALSLLFGTIPSATPAGANVIEQLKLISPHPDWGNRFGWAVAIQGDVAVIGEKFGGSNSTGVAHVYDTTGWTRLYSLTASDADYIDTFGTALAISGDTLLVGASHNDDACPEIVNCDSGAAYLFDMSTRQQLFKFADPEALEKDEFGYSVAISASRALIGAPGHDSAGTRDAIGAAYLFDTKTGEQLIKLTASDPGRVDNFGQSVAISGNTAVVGTQRGRGAYVFDVVTGEEIFKFIASDAPEGERFGHIVAIDGNTAITTGNRAAYVFDVTTGEQLKKLVPSDGAHQFGRSVAIDGDLAIISSPSNTYLFDLRTGRELAKFLDGDASGMSVAIDGHTMIVGDGNAMGLGATPYNWGAAYVFSLETPIGDTNADGLVNIDDLNNVRNNFGDAGPDDGTLGGDAFPFDGLVNIDDLNAVRNHFGAGAAVPVPEPGGAMLALLGTMACAVGYLRRTHRQRSGRSSGSM